MDSDGLSDRDRAILDFETEHPTWVKYVGWSKESVVRERFGMSLPRYYQVLNALLDTAAALAYAPLTVRRLQRLRDQRRNARGA